ncbi:hypothetical protein N7474_008139 [Penicillium riverlandense]|uniref:uncharacterized protein n=1 Tax=Penicillium riverlandense TaxID=1903569 RepID=UPI002546AAF7|nr:uncharacterized protein N7474_008139 [Penicillium riverlandense]KAJ5811838.1 hypothetical protein N7474_008139 [Penicillium riverlandense]
MSEEEKTPSTPNKAIAALSTNSPRAESPTTARPLNFDDEEPQESGIISTATGSVPQSDPETAPAPPPKPPRPLSPREQSELTLKEAFPSLDGAVVKAVLVASNWHVERAFNALLGMTDPTAQEDMVPPPKPPRPDQPPTTTDWRQVEADERYARQLAEHYNSSRRGPRPGWESDPRYQRPRGSEEDEERDYSFFDDDLPVIRENIKKGFLETQTKVNSWVANLKKRIDGEDVDEEDDGYSAPPQTYGRPRRSGDMGRRSGDREHYDADPQVLGDDFSALELRDSEAPPTRPPRPGANSGFHKAPSPSPDRRKVSFQEGPPTEIDTSAARQSSTGNKASKWQPLSQVDPSPVAENDPFSLGDSDDEKDTKTKEQTTVPESEQIKKATEEAMSGNMGSSKDSKPDESSK